MRCKKTSFNILLLIALVALWRPLPTGAQEAVFLIRHAEQALDGDDPALTELGHQRAARLATVFASAGLQAIYTSESRRTIQTAQPVAKGLAIESRIVPRRQIEPLVKRLAVEHHRDRVLVVSHSQTIPVLLKALGHRGEVAIGRDEYESIFVVVPRQRDSPVVLRLRF